MKMLTLLTTSVLLIVTSAAVGGESETPNGPQPSVTAQFRDRLSADRAEMPEEDNVTDSSDGEPVEGDLNTQPPAPLPDVAHQDAQEDNDCPRLTSFDAAGHAGLGKWIALATDDQDAQAPAAGQDAPPAHKGGSLAEINNKLNNPGANLAQLNFKFTWNQFEGDLPGASSQDSLTLAFQPVFPFKLPDDGNLILRPTIPVTWSPYFQPAKGGFGEQFGLGDIQLNTFYSRTDVKKGFMWGLGVVVQAPTHTSDVLGTDQFQMGPTGFAGAMGKWGSAGIFPQHL
jgi:hypothetical protein